VIAGRQLTGLRRYLVADGFFRKSKFVNGLLALNLPVMSKLWSDADLSFQ
jgi:hypothetical protein